MLHAYVFNVQQETEKEGIGEFLRDRAATGHVVYAYKSSIWEAKAGKA